MSLFSRSPVLPLLGAILALTAVAAHGTTTDYFGRQALNKSLSNPAPPALLASVTTAQAAFAGAVTTSLGKQDFETGSTGFSYTGGTATVSSGSPCMMYKTVTAAAGCNAFDSSVGRYNTSPKPLVPPSNQVTDWGHWIETSSSFSYSFSTGISAFSMMVTDLGDFGGTFELALFNGATQLAIPTTALTNTTKDSNNSGNGNLLFYGITTDSLFDRIEFRITQTAAVGATQDWLGFDDITVGTSKSLSTSGGSVPEPGSMALVGLALAGLGLASKRRSRT